jgi:vitamin B12 transporter
MVKVFFALIAAALLLIPCLVLAQESPEVTLEPVVVTATRIEVPLEDVGKAVTVITAAQLQQEQKTTSLANVLQSVPGVLVEQQQGPGGMALIRIRGLGSEYTQILIDGLPVRDASDPQGSAVEFMSDILIENIERIEVVRGASSTLYGSDSVGGTINIITKKGATTPEQFAFFEGGSMATYQESVGANGMIGIVNYALLGKRIDSDGLDAHDTYRETAITGRFGVDFSQDMSLSAQLKYSDSKKDLNNSPEILNGVLIEGGDDPDDTKTKTLFNGGISFNHRVSDTFDYLAKIGYVDVERKFTFGPAGADEAGFGSTTTYSGNTFNAEAQANYTINQTHLMTVGYAYEAEQFEQKIGERKDTPDATQHAVYLQDSISLFKEALSIVPGIRYVHHDQAGDRADWEVSASYKLGESGVRLHSHVGTGFRAPSLYELYGASVFGSQLYEYGNKNLDPEESLGWDAGVEVKAFEAQARFNATYFRNKFDQIISFQSAGYANVDGGESNGVEFEAAYTPIEALTVTGSYTYTHTEDANGKKFFDIPEHELSANLNYHFLGKFTANLAVTLKGQEDIPLFNPTTFTSERYQTDGYVQVDLGLNYALSGHFNVWTRVENLFDEDYNVGGYEAPGISFYGGVKATL